MNCSCAVIGAGVVGIAIARAIAAQGIEVLLIEKSTSFGSGVSSRNSEVVHAGLYYEPNSMKAIFCTKGKNLLYKFCRKHAIPFSICGKLIVASPESKNGMRNLEKIRQTALKNGVNDVRLLTASEANQMEKDIACQGALFSPSTGIVDSFSFMTMLEMDASSKGATLVLNTEVIDGFSDTNHLYIKTNGSDAMTLRCDCVVNAAGLGASTVANFFSNSAPVVKEYAKGNYFRFNGKSPFSHLIYPLPEDSGGLGIHATLDMQGRIRFGPDVDWINTIDYKVNEKRLDIFYKSIRRYWPGLPDNSLTADYAGIRPKIVGKGQYSPDFVLQTEKEHSISGLINLLGIESPGLTSSLAIAEYVAFLVKRGFDAKSKRK